ncbi:MAG: alpha/beta fold hydrolase [Nocardioides sp.]
MSPDQHSDTATPVHWTRYDASIQPQALVLMLHGGKDRGEQVVDGRSLSWRRSASMQREVARRFQEAGASTWLLRFARRGWNGGVDRIADARRALDDVRRELGDVPVVLLGHSMGGRTAVHVADDPSVRGVVALAPWLPPGESVTALAGKDLYAAHGRRDRITSARGTAEYVRRASEVAAHTEFHDMGNVGHYLLRERTAWNDFAVDSALRVLTRHG